MAATHRLASGAGGGVVNELERIVARTRAEVEQRREAVPAGAPRGRRGGARGRRAAAPVRGRRWLAPGLSVIAEHKRRSPSAGHDPRGRPARGCRRRLRARRGRRAVGADRGQVGFGGSLAGSAAGRARRRACRSCARTSSSIAYQVVEAMAAGADAILLIVAALDRIELAALLRAGGRAAGWACWSRSTTTASCGGGRGSARGDDRDQQPRPDDAEVDTARTIELLPRRAGGGDGRRRVRVPHARGARAAGRRRRRRGAGRRGADALAGHRGGLPGADRAFRSSQAGRAIGAA